MKNDEYNPQSGSSANTTQPLISIVIAVFNREKTLRECLESIKSQTFKNFELLVIDGGSTDNTVQILGEYTKEISYLISEPDSGIYDAWNKALERTTGDWVCFVGSDDYFRNNDVLSKIANELLSIPITVDFVYSKVMLVNQSGEDLYITGEPWNKSRKQLTRGMAVPHPAMMHRRRLFERGGFDQNYKIAGDYELFLRESNKDNVIFLQDVESISMRQGGISSQHENYKKSLLECRKAQKVYGQRFPSLLWLIDILLSDVRIAMFRFLGEKRTRNLIDQIRKLFGLPAYWSKL